MPECYNKHHKKRYSIQKPNSAKLEITISEEVAFLILIYNMCESLIRCDVPCYQGLASIISCKRSGILISG